MAPKIASLLIELVAENEFAKRPVLVFTSHSAGGVVATMLYAHMLKVPNSILTPFMDNFATYLCITFGAPPITFPPLNFFFARSTLILFVNEGDPIPKCDREYVNSLLRLWVSPMPKGEVEWPLPEPVLENSGAVIGIPKATDEEGCSVFVMMDESGEDRLEARIFGDPKAHKMDLYLRKVQLVEVGQE